MAMNSVRAFEFCDERSSNVMGSRFEYRTVSYTIRNSLYLLPFVELGYKFFSK